MKACSPSFPNAYCAALLVLLAALSASAANDTWNGSAADGNWQSAANWGGTVPLPGDALFFDGVWNTATMNNFPDGTPFAGLAFNSSASSFVISGNMVLLSGMTNGITVGVSNGSYSAQTVNVNLDLDAGWYGFSSPYASLALNGTLTRGSAGSIAYFDANNVASSYLATDSAGLISGLSGAGLIASGNVFTGPAAVSGGVIGAYNYSSDPQAQILSGGGTLSSTTAAGAVTNVELASSSAVTYTLAATTYVNTILATQTSVNTIATASGKNLVMGPVGAILANLGGSASSTAKNVITISGAGSITAGGPVSGTPGTLIFGVNGSGTGNSMAITCGTPAITDNGASGKVTVVKIGTGSMYINNNSTYSGGTYVDEGFLQINAAEGLGTGPVYVAAGCELFLPNLTTPVTNNFFLSPGTGYAGANVGALTARAATPLLGTITLRGNPVTAAPGDRIGTANTVQLLGQITGSGTLELLGNAGSFLFSNVTANVNNWTGGLIIDHTGNNGTYDKIMANNQLASNNVTLIQSGTGTARLDLNGFSDTIGSLSSSNALSANAQVGNFANTASTLTLGAGNAGGTFGGVFQDGGTAAKSLSLVKIGTGTQIFSGVNSTYGNITVNGGNLVLASGSSIANVPLVTVNSNATLDLSTICPLTLSGSQALSMSNGILTVSLPASGNAVVTTALTVNGTTNYITIASIPGISAYPAQMTAIKYTTLKGTASNFGLAGPLPLSPGAPYVGFISNNVANGSVDLVLTGGPATLKWQGDAGGAPNSAWDTSTANWLAGSTVTTYIDGVFAKFDDTASTGTVTLNQDVSPASIVLTNHSLAYTFIGGGRITGSGSLVKQGSGTLILDNSGYNDFNGGVTISGGTLQIGNNDYYSGTVPAAGNVVNNGSLVFARNDNVTVANSVSGSGLLTQQGTGGTLQLAGANTFTGNVLVTNNSVLQLGSAQALGKANLTMVANGSMLDLNGFTGSGSVTVKGSGTSGQGAVDNSSATIPPADIGLTNLTLAGNTTIGASTSRWDLRSPGGTTGNPATASLSTGGQAYNLAKTGYQFFGLASATVDPTLGNIDVLAGTFNIEGNTTGLGNPTNNLTVASGAIFELWAATNQVNKVMVLNDGGTIFNGSGANTIIGPMNVTNSGGSSYCWFNVAGTSLTLSNTLTGNGLIYRSSGTNTLFLNGNSPNFAGGLDLYTPGTVVLNGTLNNSLGMQIFLGGFVLNGTLLGAGITTYNSSILAGSGTASGTADVSGPVYPGNSGIPGTLTVGGLILEGPASPTFDLGSTNIVGGGTNDLIVVNGDLTINGNFITINPQGLLMTGVRYRLFNYTGHLIWNADLVIPGQMGYSFTVDTNTPGQINVIVQGGPPVWNGGSASDSNWSDPTNWGGDNIAPGGILYFCNNARLNNTNDTAADTSYSVINFLAGSGAFVLNGNPVVPGGGIINNSSNPQRVNLGLDINNATNTFNGASGALIIGGGVTNTANLTTLTLAGTGILTNILGSAGPGSMTNTILVNSTNANWTLMDNPSASAMTVPWVFNIASGTFNFGGAGSAPALTNTTVNGAPQDFVVGAVVGSVGTFNMSNGVLTTVARLDTGTAGGATGIVNQVGGTLTIGSQVQGANGGTNAVSLFNVSGGLLNVYDTQARTFYVASRGLGTLTVSGSGTVQCGTLDLSRGVSGTLTKGVVNLNGGTLQVNNVTDSSTTANSTAAFNFNGGTLKPNGNSATFYQGGGTIPLTTTVQVGGAIINDAGYAITVAEPLLHDSTLGVTPDGGLLKLGAGTLTLTAASTYTGNTLVSNGTLVVSGSLGHTLVTVATNATLAGTGSLGSNVMVNAGGTLFPASPGVTGTLTVAGNITFQSGSTSGMQLSKGSSLSNSVLASTAGTMTYGGILSVTNLGAALAAGDHFKLFNAGSYGGTFAATNLPALGTGLGWSWDPASGMLSVIQTVNVAPTNLMTTVVGNQLTLSWPADHIGWQLQMQTDDLSAGLGTNWVNVPGSSTNNRVSVTINPANGAVFYRMVYP